MSRLKRLAQIALFLLLVLFFVFLGISIGVVIAYWNDLPSMDALEYETKSWQYPTKVYSDISRITPGISLENVMKRLQRLNYKRVSYEPTSKGQYYLKEPNKTEMKLYLREVKYPRLNRNAALIVVQIKDGKIAKINSAEGAPLDEFILEPELIDEFYSAEGVDRELVKLSHLPNSIIKAFIAIEDKRFYKHRGIDFRRIIGAILWDLRHASREQGASTITQQLREIYS